MDELVTATRLGKATTYRMYATKDELIGAWLARRRDTILKLIDDDIGHHADPRDAVLAIFEAIAQDVERPTFRGCAFHNASVEFPDPAHPARIVAREYRQALHQRLASLTLRISPGAEGRLLSDYLALIVDGMYVSAVHLGADGPAASGPSLARRLLKSS